MEIASNNLIKNVLVEARPIWIVDNMIEDKLAVIFYNNVMDLSFKRAEKTYFKDDYPIFSLDFDPEVFEEKTAIGSTGKLLMLDYTQSDNYYLERVYVNMCHYGDVGTPHRDCAINDSDITVLYYINKEWRHAWGGETIFYENKDTALAVLPKLGRFVVFPGAIEHNGSIPSRICTQARLTLAMKFKERS
jgi:SM-20-related protein